MAFITANKFKFEIDKKNKIFAGNIFSGFVNKPSEFISAMLLGNTIALVIYGISMSRILHPVIYHNLPENLRTDGLILIIQTILSAILIILVAEFAPKVLFRINPNKILNVLVLPVLFFYYLLYPVQYIFVKISEFILKFILRVKIQKKIYEISHADLQLYLKEFASQDRNNDNLPDDIQMFQNVIEFSETRIRECMVPRNEITAIDENDTIENLNDRFRGSGHSKILVYKNSIDNITGFVHVYDMFHRPKSIKAISKRVMIVPESMLAKETMRMLIVKHRSIAVVVDEFGGTSGIVTLEDLIEEITGEIDDEFDETEIIEKNLENGEYVFSGRIEIDYLNEKYHLNIPVGDDYETLAGFIISRIEKIPSPKEEFSINEFKITILKASRNRVDLIKLKISSED